MAITATDIILRYSTTSGSAGDSTASSQATSLGKYVSSTVVAAGANGLFDDVSGRENTASTVDYRCIFVLNNHATLTMQNAVVYVSAEVAGGVSVAIAVDNLPASAKASASAQAAQIATETTAPSGVGAFSTRRPPRPASPSATSPPARSGRCGSAANTAALDADGATIAVSCDTAA